MTLHSVHTLFKMNVIGLSDRINGVKLREAALTGFSYSKMYGCFAGSMKGGRNNEVTVRWASTV